MPEVPDETNKPKKSGSPGKQQQAQQRHPNRASKSLLASLCFKGYPECACSHTYAGVRAAMHADENGRGKYVAAVTSDPTRAKKISRASAPFNVRCSSRASVGR